jgi:hypothetical protein
MSGSVLSGVGQVHLVTSGRHQRRDVTGLLKKAVSFSWYYAQGEGEMIRHVISRDETVVHEVGKDSYVRVLRGHGGV